VRRNPGPRRRVKSLTPATYKRFGLWHLGKQRSLACSIPPRTAICHNVMIQDGHRSRYCPAEQH
jgi:hypothetical protein